LVNDFFGQLSDLFSKLVSVRFLHSRHFHAQEKLLLLLPKLPLHKLKILWFLATGAVIEQSILEVAPC
jgi:hypothetical protein